MVKVISLSEEAYKILKQHKGSKMSFSDTIIEKFSKNNTKTETISDLLSRIKAKQTYKVKKKIKIDIDKIVYGVGK